MAMISQGIVLQRMSTSVVQLSTTVDFQGNLINCGSTDPSLVFTAGNYITSTDNTALRPISALSSVNIYTYGGLWPSTGSTARTLTEYAPIEIGEITDFNGPGGGAAVIDISHTQSTAKGKMVGLPDEGQISVTLNFSASDAGQTLLRSDRLARQRSRYVIRFTECVPGSAPPAGGSTAAFPTFAQFYGYCMQYAVSGAVDNKISANCVIEIDGPVLWTTFYQSTV